MDEGVCYIIWQDGPIQTVIDPEESTVVDRAMKLWADSRRDTWLSLASPSGLDHGILASTITSTTRSTADQRLRGIAWDKENEDEREEHRRLAGYIESE